MSEEVVLCVYADAAEDYNPQDIVSTANHCWLPRSRCETDEGFRQLIPYCAVKWMGKYLVYDRKGTEGRLHGYASLGIGGHINVGESVYDGMMRELWEEARIATWKRTYLGNILHNDSLVSRVHLGLAYLIEAAHTPKPQEELLNARWKTLEECSLENLEPWSKDLLERLKQNESGSRGVG